MIFVGATMPAASPWRSAKGCTAILRIRGNSQSHAERRHWQYLAQ